MDQLAQALVKYLPGLEVSMQKSPLIAKKLQYKSNMKTNLYIFIKVERDLKKNFLANKRKK